jgi:Glycosyltransferase family 87
MSAPHRDKRDAGIFSDKKMRPFFLGLVVFGIWAGFLAFVLVRAYLNPGSRSVYPIFANAGREWLQGLDIYDVNVSHGPLDKFRYAPVVAVFFTALVGLPDGIGVVLWRILNVAALFAGAIAFARIVFPGRARLTATTAIALAALLLPLSLGSINNAQSNTLIVGCLLLGVAAAADQRCWLAAVCLAVPVVFKIYPAAVVLLILLVQPRLGWRLGLALAASCLLPFALQEPNYVAGAYQSWFNQIAHDNRHTGQLENSYRDFFMLMRVTGLHLSERHYQVLQLGMAGLVAAIVVRSQRFGCGKTRLLRASFDLGCCWIILFGPATENSTYALLAPTLALAAWEAFQPGEQAWRRWWMAATVGLFLSAVLIISTPIGKSVSFYLMPMGGLMMFCERIISCCRLRPEVETQMPAIESIPQTA